MIDYLKRFLIRSIVQKRPDLRVDVDTPFEIVRAAARKMLEDFASSKVESAAKKYAERTNDWNKKELGRAVSAALGVPLTALEKPTQNRVPEFVKENVALIKTVPERAHDRVQALVTEALMTGMRPETMIKQLQEIGDISENDARRIARDQIGKLNAQVNVDRQKSLGVKRAIWRTVRDNRVRDEHVDREGEEFDLSLGIDGEFPGSAIQCRCFAEPVFDFGQAEDA